MDDFVYRPELEPLIAMANIIKFDFRPTPKAAINDYLKQLSRNSLCLLAEKVETHDEFDAAQKMGFELFQGYFFCKPEMFTLGMFSLIDAVIDQPMEKILGELPLSSQIKHALIDAKGRLAGHIALVRSYEAGQWGLVARLAQALKLDGNTLPALYLQAYKWSDIAAEAS